IHNVDTAVLLRRFVEEQKPLGFLATGKTRASSAGKPQELDEMLLASMQIDAGTVDNFGQCQSGDDSVSADPISTSGRPVRKQPVLESTLAQEPLFLQLLKMRSEAQSFMEEQGANLLFL